MADMAKKAKSLKTRSERELERIEGMSSKPAAAPAPAPKEMKAGAPRSKSDQKKVRDETTNRLVQQLRDRIAKTEDPAKKADLRARIKAVQDAVK